MRTARTALTALVFAGALSVAATAQPPAPALVQPALNAAVAVAVGVHGTVGVDYFYSNLAPYGYWVDRPSYGWVWVPRHIRHGWRPYSYGRWVYTDYGWTWASAEPFGWATYHYGRWNLDPDYGWAWVPGTDWGPSWVSWQQGDGYIGWAPLPPQVGFSAGVGLDFGSFNLSAGIDPGWYCFAPERSFLAVNVGSYIVPPYQNVAIIHNTTNITNYRVEGGRVFNGSVPVDRIQQVTGQPVRQLHLANASDPRVARISGNSVAMFRPAAVVKRANAPDPSHVVPHAVATGRVAQQLAQQRRGEAAQFRSAGAQGQNAAARAAQVNAGRHAGQTPAARNQQQQAQARGQSGRVQQQQAQARRQSALAGRSQQQAQSRRQPTSASRSQQQASRRQSTPAGRSQQQAQSRRQFAPAGRSQQQHRQSAPPPQRRQQQAQVRRQSAPPPQRQQQAQVRRQSAPPPQRQPQVQRQQPPPRQAQAQRPSPPPQRQAAPPPPRQARAQAPPPQQRRQRQPPPPSSGGGNR
jgi:hypothetical protein